MSTSLQQQLDDFLFYGAEMPDLAQGCREVPMPQGFYVCLTCKAVTNYWEPGAVCQKCESDGEREQEFDR